MKPIIRVCLPGRAKEPPAPKPVTPQCSCLFGYSEDCKLHGDSYWWDDGSDFDDDADCDCLDCDGPDPDECMCDGFCLQGYCDVNPNSYFDHTPGADNTPPWEK